MALGLAVVVAGVLEVWVPALSSGAQAMEQRPALTLAALVAGAALVLRRVRPLLSLPLVLAAVQVQIWLAGTESLAGLAAVLVALFAVGTTAARQPALLGLGVAAWWVLVQGEDLADYAFGLLLVGGPWVAGRLVRGRQLLLDELGSAEPGARGRAAEDSRARRGRGARPDRPGHARRRRAQPHGHDRAGTGGGSSPDQRPRRPRTGGRGRVGRAARRPGRAAPDPAAGRGAGRRRCRGPVAATRRWPRWMRWWTPSGAPGCPVTLSVSGPPRALPPRRRRDRVPRRPGGPDERRQARRLGRRSRARSRTAGRAGRRGVRRGRRTGCCATARGSPAAGVCRACGTGSRPVAAA